MAKNPFNPKDVPDFKVPRNSFDMSNNELFTTEFGQLVPVSCTEVIPGDTFKINSFNVGVRGMPTAFPVQTPIKGRLSWFYVRNRTLWKDFEDFIYQTKENLQSPYLHYTRDKSNLFSTGSLADCLGLPTTKGVVGQSLQSVKTNEYLNFNKSSGNGVFLAGVNTAVISVANLSALLNGDPQSNLSLRTQRNLYFNAGVSTASDGFEAWFSEFTEFVPTSVQVSMRNPRSSALTLNCYVGLFCEPTYLGTFMEKQPYLGNSVLSSLVTASYAADAENFEISVPSSLATFAASHPGRYSIGVFTRQVSPSSLFSPLLDSSADWTSVGLVGLGPVINDIPPAESPFLTDTDMSSQPLVKISALPFRAYEMCCQYYFRNDLNNPIVYDGQVEYNKFIPTDDGGADTYPYDFHYHNLELDYFTSAVQSPQFGAAPLVGLEYNVGAIQDTVTLAFEDADDSSKKYEVVAGVNGNGELLNLVNFSKDLPAANLRNLMNLIDTGFSINTLRNVNAFQRFKENTIRRGLRYRNQLKSHAGVDVDYPDIDVPQYLGGVSAYLNVSQINNMSDTGNVGLGDYIGTLSGVVNMQHSIQHFCTEHGFIIGIFSISPTPVYPQSTAPYLLRNHPLSYFQTEFGKIGYVPIPYSLVAPAESDPNNDKYDPNTAVFGYQRAWYDYMQKLDNIHGDFRTTLMDFTLARQFTGLPLLGRQFTKVNPDDYRHVFLDRNIATEYSSNAKFLLSCSSNIDMLRQIPRHGVPSLE